MTAVWTVGVSSQLRGGDSGVILTLVLCADEHGVSPQCKPGMKQAVKSSESVLHVFKKVQARSSYTSDVEHLRMRGLQQRESNRSKT